MPHYKISSSPTRGRSLVATVPLKPGTLIDAFSPGALILPSAPSRTQVCAHCLARAASLKRCTACKSLAYCSPACQKADWKSAHKPECPVLSRAAASTGADAPDGAPVPTAVRAAIRILVKPEAYGALETELNGHVDDFESEGGQKWKDLELQAQVLMGWLEKEWPEGEEKAKRRVVEILCKIQTNAFSRSEPETNQDGIFMHPTLAMVNHSCVPNALVVFHRRKAFLRALRPIGAGEEIEISYIDCTQPLAQRRKDLAHYHFTCSCPRCKDDLDNYQVAALAPPNMQYLQAITLAPSFNPRSPPPPPSEDVTASESGEALEAIKKILPPSGTGNYNLTERHRQLSRAYRASPSLRAGDRWANEPNSHFLAEATSYYVAQGDFEAALAISSLAALESDPYKFVEPFHPHRMHGYMKLANSLTNTAPRPENLHKFAQRVLAATGQPKEPAKTLEKLDHVSLCQIILCLVALHAPKGHSEEWQVLGEAVDMLDEILSLPGRDHEKGLIMGWANNPEEGTMREFFRYAAATPLQALAAVGKAALEAEFSAEV